MLAKAAHGRGYAAEAVGRLLAWGDERFSRTVCVIDPANAPSLRLAARLGYVPFADGAYHGSPRVLLRRERRTLPAGRRRDREPGADSD